ncbi:MAG: SWIM zinc finger family protein [Thermoleophilia bacterium]|nr:SWIM zinc finger family protein [Thermoleophilia bacterium]
MSELLSAVLNEPLVATLAGPRSFERGLVYLEEGHVGPLRVSAERVAAHVQGAAGYEVELSANGGRLRYECSCPVGSDGTFCKHCVAVALRWLRHHGTPGPTLDDARELLESLPAATLAELLIDHAHQDDVLARRLLLMTTRPASGAEVDAVVLRALIDQAFAYHNFVPYREMHGYLRGIDEMLEVLDGLLDEGHSGQVTELCEYALAAAERALDHVDDSGGQMREALERLEDLHLRACQRAQPDPAALAARLFAREVEGEWDVFDRAVARYADVLGDAGLARYRELADERWATVPALGPGPGHSRTLRRALSDHADHGNSRGAVGEPRRSDRRARARSREQVQLPPDRRAVPLTRRRDAALEWAQRGNAAIRDAPDPRLRSFLIGAYRRRGRHADALEQSLAAFAARPALETYRDVAQDAQALGQWPERRAAAMTLLTSQGTESPTVSRHPSLRGRGCSELGRVLLWEGDPDAAWRAANEGGCTRDLWLELADRRREQHPEDALTVYRRHVEDVIGHKDKRAYQRAVAIIDETIRALYAECGRSEEFPEYVDGVRATHKPKRNLMKLMASSLP